MRLIVKMAMPNYKKTEIKIDRKLTPKEEKHLAITNRLKSDGYRILPVSVDEFLR